MKKTLIFTLIIIFVFVFFLINKNKISVKRDIINNNTENIYKPNSTASPIKPITNDDSFNSIDVDLNNTIISSEDFSDLK